MDGGKGWRTRHSSQGRKGSGTRLGHPPGKKRRPRTPRIISWANYLVTVSVIGAVCTEPPLVPLTTTVYVPSGVLIPPDCCVLMVSRDVALPAPGTTDAGENEQLAPVGNPEQLNATGLLKLPPTAETVMVGCALSPERTLRLTGAETA